MEELIIRKNMFMIDDGIGKKIFLQNAKK